MTPAEIEAALQAAFAECDAAFCSLTQEQRQVLLQVVLEQLTHQNQLYDQGQPNQEGDRINPLDELTPDRRRALLEFVKEKEQQNQLWKIQLLNDWLENRESGSVQFLRDHYGVQWLNRIQPSHLAEYYEREYEEGLKIRVGSCIEVASSLWEWVQENGLSDREWFPCTVVSLYDTYESNGSYTNCIIRFDNGTEYEIQGVYQWNRYNWRWKLT